MNSAQLISLLIQASYFAAAVLLIMGIKRMSSPVTARSGIQWAGVGVLVAVIATFFHSGMHNVVLMLAATVASCKPQHEPNIGTPRTKISRTRSICRSASTSRW